MRRALPPEPRNIWAEYRRRFGEGVPVVAFGSRGTPARVERWMRGDPHEPQTHAASDLEAPRPAPAAPRRGLVATLLRRGRSWVDAAAQRRQGGAAMALDGHTHSFSGLKP